jgi:hypothetical protein
VTIPTIEDAIRLARRDNADLRRNATLDEKALERFQRYRKARFELTES